MDKVERFIKADKFTKELIMSMNGLSEEGFQNKIMNDPFFHKAYNVILNLIIRSRDLDE